jgi:hypothetical protein
LTILQNSMTATGIEVRFKDVVAVEHDANADGSDPNDEGSVSPEWSAVPGLQAVKCLIYEDQSQRAPGQEMTEDLTTGTILFGISPHLPRDRMLRFAAVDRASGKTIHYYANGKITSPADAYQRVRVRLGAIT